MKQNYNLTFKIEYDKYVDYTRIAAEINDRFVMKTRSMLTKIVHLHLTVFSVTSNKQ